MQHIMKFNGLCQTPVNDDCNHLLHDLNQANSLVAPSPPLYISTILYRVHSTTSSLILKMSFTLCKTIYHLDSSGSFSDLSSASHNFRCLPLIPNDSPKRLAQTCLKAHLTSASSRTPSDTPGGSTRIGIISSLGGMFW